MLLILQAASVQHVLNGKFTYQNTTLLLPHKTQIKWHSNGRYKLMNSLIARDHEHFKYEIHFDFSHIMRSPEMERDERWKRERERERG